MYSDHKLNGFGWALNSLRSNIEFLVLSYGIPVVYVTVK